MQVFLNWESPNLLLLSLDLFLLESDPVSYISYHDYHLVLNSRLRQDHCTKIGGALNLNIKHVRVYIERLEYLFEGEDTLTELCLSDWLVTGVSHLHLFSDFVHDFSF